MRRRALLAACATAGLAGCLGGDSDSGSTATATDPGDGGSVGAVSNGGGGTDADGAGDTDSPTPTTSSTETPGATTGAGATQSTTATGTGTGTPVHPGYETTEVRMVTPDGERLASVTAAIADTPDLRYLGLSDTEHLPQDRGMLFVYEEVGDHTFVMREMDFGIDIVYADDEGVITRIHHAPAPGPNEDGNEQRYPGRGQYVLEVNYEFTTEHGVEEGDILEFEL